MSETRDKLKKLVNLEGKLFSKRSLKVQETHFFVQLIVLVSNQNSGAHVIMLICIKSKAMENFELSLI
jgi:hypothetical protein